MILSVSSIFITLIMGTILIFLLYLLLFNEKLIYLLRADLLFSLSLIIILRLLIPFEWPFTITIPFSWIMNPLQLLLDFEIFRVFSIKNSLFFIWIIGSLIQFIRFLFQLKKISNIFDVLKKSSKKKRMSDYMNVENSYNYQIWIDNTISSPMICKRQIATI